MSFDPAGLSLDHPPATFQPPPILKSKQYFQQKTWREAAQEREVSAPLAMLPSGIGLNDDFPEPMQYDANRRVLRYRGFMSNTSFQELQRLSNDLDYMRALEQLFTASAIEPQPARHYGLIAGAAVGVLALLLLGWRFIH